MKRRDFLKNIALTAGTISPLAKVTGGLGLLSTSTFANTSFGDYKAIVLISLDGGNDAMNMFPPTNTTYSDYQQTRGDLAVSLTNLYEDSHYQVDDDNHFTGAEGANQPYYKVEPGKESLESNAILMYTKGSYHTTTTENNITTQTGLGINALMPEFASLYQKGVLSIVSNVGTLVEPTTKAQIEDGSAQLPVFLFAHNHQKLAVASTQAETLAKTGWAGRLADHWNLNGAVGLNISYAGPERTLIGESTSALAMSTTSPAAYKSINSGEKFEELLNNFDIHTTNTNHLNRVYNIRNRTTAQLSSILTQYWASAPNFSTSTKKNSYGKELFTSYKDGHKEKLGMRSHHGLIKSFFEQLEATAKMIQISKEGLEHKRQIFYVRGTGYDSHSDQVERHSRNLRTVSLAISDFYKALESMGLEEDVLVISTSEFGRTLKSNGDGTDHGWGGHSFMLSGNPQFSGGKVFGHVMTDLSLNGVNAYTSRARIIPTTAIEQMLAPALKWFGVPEATMAHVLPNLQNFKTDESNIESAFLQGVFNEG
ncbi:MAG: DUF1501 domain-containing protein [Epsilonproteobacteria bacterium]|nr:DUF1501 domain-containing protein [Campylobacterota bacterium]